MVESFVSSVGPSSAIARTLPQDLVNDRLFGNGFEAQVDETRSGNLNVLHPSLNDRAGEQGLLQRQGDLAWVGFEHFAQLQSVGDGQVAMGGELGALKGGVGAQTLALEIE